jgi:hypothetical protein
MGYEQTAASRGYDPAQIERDWTMAQARIDALAEAGTQAIQRLLQHTLQRAQRAQRADATPDQRADGQALPDPGSSDIDHLAQAL